MGLAGTPSEQEEDAAAAKALLGCPAGPGGGGWNGALGWGKERGRRPAGGAFQSVAVSASIQDGATSPWRAEGAARPPEVMWRGCIIPMAWPRPSSLRKRRRARLGRPALSEASLPCGWRGGGAAPPPPGPVWRAQLGWAAAGRPPPLSAVGAPRTPPPLPVCVVLQLLRGKVLVPLHAGKRDAELQTSWQPGLEGVGGRRGASAGVSWVQSRGRLTPGVKAAGVVWSRGSSVPLK